ncbi:hypothetical protein Golob_024743 [Gossypium lobatum]|uniref:Uncharacterized protein n=1 Tax=Gossypium lobatum TaxID=34289 RepID=A0A7J8NJ60_9ROSI|nr:hypothetical protein [Gossypium lobatum]
MVKCTSGLKAKIFFPDLVMALCQKVKNKMPHLEFIVRWLHEVQSLYNDYVRRHGVWMSQFLPCKYAPILLHGQSRKKKKNERRQKKTFHSFTTLRRCSNLNDLQLRHQTL